MKLRITHELDYQYSDEVFLEPHYLYLHPKKSSMIALESYDIQISPTPDFFAKNLDSSDNIQQVAFFKEKTKHLNIKVVSEVLTTEFNPFSFVYHPYENHQLPVKYSPELEIVLQPCLIKSGVTTLIDQTARQIAASVNWKTGTYLTALNEYINQFTYEIREEGAAFDPEKTLLERRGSCRDYSVLYMAFCRVLGIASRFVSGFYYGDAQQETNLHAWVEVYLPGGGWRGFDPTQNCLVAGNHVPLGASAMPNLIAPIVGSFRGQASSFFSPKVTITQYEE